MGAIRGDFNIFSASEESDGISSAIAKYMGANLSPCHIVSKANGEVAVSIDCNVRAKDVYVVQCCGRETNTRLMEILFLLQEAKMLGAKSLTAVLPLLPYARSDRPSSNKTGQDGATPLRLVAITLEAAGVNRIMTMEMHSPQIRGFFSVPVDNFSPFRLYKKWIQTKITNWEESIVVSPDEAGTYRAGRLASILSLPMAVVSRVRDTAHTDRLLIAGNVTNKQLILIDDIVDSCFTLMNAVKLLIESGQASSIWILVTHAIMTKWPTELLAIEQVKALVLTNTLKMHNQCDDASSEKDKVHVLDVCMVFGEGIRRTHHGEALSFNDII